METDVEKTSCTYLTSFRDEKKRLRGSTKSPREIGGEWGSRQVRKGGNPFRKEESKRNIFPRPTSMGWEKETKNKRIQNPTGRGGTGKKLQPGGKKWAKP